MKKVRIACIAAPDMIPEYLSAGSCGADLRADIAEDVVLEPGQRIGISTGVRLQLPEGLEAQIRPRSGLALNHGITVLNSPGSIDSDYRGELQVILINHGQRAFTIRRGDRIAQLVLAPVVRAEFQIRSSISMTERGARGFGSTGR